MSKRDEIGFGPEPSRDGRFDVKQHWIDCTGYEGDHPLRLVEFLNRQMNEEMNGLECCAQSLVDFPDADWGIRMHLARQCADEARHVQMFRRELEARGGRVGQFPVLNFQFRIISGIPTLLGRLVVQNRCFEAGGIDAIADGIKEANQDGDGALEALFEAQLADEIVHVRVANEWIREQTASKPGLLLQMGSAMAAAVKGFREVMGQEGANAASYAADFDGRLEAGFTPSEIAIADDLADRGRTDGGR